MSATLVAGWVSTARHVPSPNCEPRPPGVAPELVVIHNISLPPGEFGGPGIEQLFTNTLDWDAHPYYQSIRGLRVSAHFLLRRDGELLQFVSTEERAWHAGVSCWQGRDNCNDFSIGIELEGTDTQAYTEAQYAGLKRLIGLLRKHYPGIGPGDLAGHADVAPGRKTDPGPAFDWSRLNPPSAEGELA
ncbi:MAG: 1,6-anhydro-N-acetylmuramyl-L-alanine amidase AmpD [Haliea sp.]|nr:1,6-anhydro-N-acetylmuramyl-L-alanine amidase AmpD [Haliea sp.]|tara:strand:+ start:100419 stop:100982 length:564 start_codon:yes stop_codon:yes gene_type:complete